MNRIKLKGKKVYEVRIWIEYDGYDCETFLFEKLDDAKACLRRKYCSWKSAVDFQNEDIFSLSGLSFRLTDENDYYYIYGSVYSKNIS